MSSEEKESFRDNNIIGTPSELKISLIKQLKLITLFTYGIFCFTDMTNV